MNLKFSYLLIGAAALSLASCSVYKSGQTPDDVYYSPGNTGVAYASGNDDNRSDYLETNNRRRYNDDPNQIDDQYMRMAIATGRRPLFFDDFAMMNPYYRNNWAFNSMMMWNSPFNSPWNSMYMWNSFYNPYWGVGNGFYGGGFGFGFSPGWGTGWGPGYGYGWGGGHPWVGGGGWAGHPGGGFVTAPRPSRPRSAFTMGSYLNTNSNRNGSSYRVGNMYNGNYNNRNNYNNNRTFNNSNNNRNRANTFNNNRQNTFSNDRPTRSYTPASSGSSGSSSRGSSGGGVSRPARTGN